MHKQPIDLLVTLQYSTYSIHLPQILLFLQWKSFLLLHCHLHLPTPPAKDSNTAPCTKAESGACDMYCSGLNLQTYTYFLSANTLTYKIYLKSVFLSINSCNYLVFLPLVPCKKRQSLAVNQAKGCRFVYTIHSGSLERGAVPVRTLGLRGFCRFAVQPLLHPACVRRRMPPPLSGEAGRAQICFSPSLSVPSLIFSRISS